MTTYTRESLNKLNEDYKLEMYNTHTEKIVEYITKAVVMSAKLEGKKEFINVVRIIEDNPQQNFNRGISRKIDYTTIDVYDAKQIDTIIEKLKIIFLGISIEYIESKDIRGKHLKTAIRVNWE